MRPLTRPRLGSQSMPSQVQHESEVSHDRKYSALLKAALMARRAFWSSLLQPREAEAERGVGDSIRKKKKERKESVVRLEAIFCHKWMTDKGELARG